MINVAVKGVLEISKAAFQCTGARDGAGTWTLRGDWVGNESLNLGEFVDELFPDLPFDPEDVLPTLTFKSASVTLIPGVSRSFACVSSVAFFGAQFEVGVAIDPTGILLTGSHVGEIDLAFVQLTGSNNQLPGPTAKVDTRDPKGAVYQLDCGISVFNKPFLPTTFTYQPEIKKYSGTAAFDGTFIGIQNPSVTFTYSDTEGLRITSWPLAPVLDKKILGYAKMLEQASADSKCGQLVGLLFDKAIETDFDLSLSQGGAVTASGLPVKLTGTYSTKVAGETLFTLKMPEINGSIPVPKSFDFDGLLKWLTKTIVANAAAIGKALLNDTTALKVLIAKFAIDYTKKELVDNLVCRGVVDSQTIHNEVEKESDEVDENLKKVKEAAEEALTSTSIATAATALGAAALALPVLLAAVKKLIDFLEDFVDWLTGGSDEKDAAEDKRDEGEEVVENARNRIKGLIAMEGTPTVTFTSATTVKVSWTEGNRPHQRDIDYDGYDGFTYSVDIATDAAFTNIVASGPGAWSFQAQNAAFAQVNTVYGRVWAHYGDFAGASITGSTFHLVQLPSPASVTQSQTAGQDSIDVTIAAVTGATSYQVELLDSTHLDSLADFDTLADWANIELPFDSTHATQLVPQPGGSPTTVLCRFAGADIPVGTATGAKLLARAKAVGDPGKSFDSRYKLAPVASVVATAGPPASVQATVGISGVAGSWDAVASAASYSVRAVDGSGVPLNPQPAINVSGLTCTISSAGIVVGTIIGVEVRPVVATAIGLWSQLAKTVVHVPVTLAAGPHRFTATLLSFRESAGPDGQMNFLFALPDSRGVFVTTYGFLSDSEMVNVCRDAHQIGARWFGGLRARFFAAWQSVGQYAADAATVCGALSAQLQQGAGDAAARQHAIGELNALQDRAKQLSADCGALVQEMDALSLRVDAIVPRVVTVNQQVDLWNTSDEDERQKIERRLASGAFSSLTSRSLKEAWDALADDLNTVAKVLAQGFAGAPQVIKELGFTEAAMEWQQLAVKVGGMAPVTGWNWNQSYEWSPPFAPKRLGWYHAQVNDASDMQLGLEMQVAYDGRLYMAAPATTPVRLSASSASSTPMSLSIAWPPVITGPSPAAVTAERLPGDQCGYFRIRFEGTGMYLSAEGGSLAPDARLELHEWVDRDDQKWRPALVNQAPLRVLSVTETGVPISNVTALISGWALVQRSSGLLVTVQEETTLSPAWPSPPPAIVLVRRSSELITISQGEPLSPWTADFIPLLQTTAEGRQDDNLGLSVFQTE